MLNFADPEIYREVLEHLPTAVYFVDAEEKIRFWNEGAEKITGYLRQDVVGHFCRENILSRISALPPGSAREPSPGLAARAATNLGATAEPDTSSPFQIALRDGRASEAEMFIHHRDGHRLAVRVRAIPIRSDAGTVIGVAETFDVSIGNSEWDRRQNRLSRYGALDEETGVLNLRVTQSHLRESLATFEEHRLPVSILLIEIDQLVQLKAKYGPQIAPAALYATGQTIESFIRPTDFLGRWDEHRLLVILIECSPFELPAVANKLEQLADPTELRWWGDNLELSISIGGASAQRGDSTEMLIARATAALAEAAKAGGGLAQVRY